MSEWTQFHDHNPPSHRAPRVERVEVMVVHFTRGIGCCEEHVYREVTAYYLPDGTLIAEHDPAQEPVPA